MAWGDLVLSLPAERTWNLLGSYNILYNYILVRLVARCMHTPSANSLVSLANSAALPLSCGLYVSFENGQRTYVRT